MRLLVCGSRTFSDGSYLYDILDEVSIKYDIDVLIHGDAKGADTLAKEWAETVGLDKIEAYPADWDKHGRAAGPIRNKQMLDEGKPDLVVAFIDKPLDQSRGTKNMVEIAKKAGIKTFVEGKSARR
jgi:YspA, cpYpsA-related SLOG family